MLVEESLQIAVQRAHFVDRVHRVVGRADLSEARGRHELKKVQTGLAVRRAFKLHVVLRQNFMSRVFDRAVALDISVDQSA